ILSRRLQRRRSQVSCHPHRKLRSRARWQHDAEMTSSRSRNYLDTTAVRLDEIARDGQAQAGALGAPGGTGAAAKECIEDCVALLQRNARAGIDDVNLDLAGPLLRQQRYDAP